MDWFEFIAAFAVFFLSHSIPTRPGIRDRIVTMVGERGFTLLYSLLSLAVLYWLLMAAGRAPYVGLWDRYEWQNHVPLAAMGLVALITTFTLGRPVPLSFGGMGQFDPAHPGINRWMRHPILVALAIWAFAHLVPNGDLSHVIVFGTFAGFALLGSKLIDRRKKRMMGAAWDQTRAAIHSAPRLPRPASWVGVVVRLVLALVVYMGLLHLHEPLFGISPLL